MPGKFPQVAVARGGIVIDDAWMPPLAYTAYLPQEDFYRQIGECGMHLYCFPAYLAERGINIHSGIGPFRRGVWQGIGAYDFSPIEDDLNKILAADPQARVLMRIHLDVPQWWEEQFPEECCQQKNGEPLRQSFTSPVWRQTAGQALRDILAWFADSSYASHLAGVHVAAGGTEEWVYHYFGNFEDASPSRLAAFNDFLQTEYADHAARQAAWSTSNVSSPDEALSVLSCPGEERWRDPNAETAALDACHFHSVALTEAIAYFCRVVKEASDGRLLTGAFYGYHFYIPDVRKGHTALSRLLACEELDYLASPNMYCREPGVDWPPMVAVDSVRLHGKLWMAENDTRTALTHPLKASASQICPPGQYEGGVWEGPASMETSVGLLQANVARMLTHGYGGWWFDMWGGWFAHPDLLAVIARAQTFWDEELSLDDADVVPADTLCVVVDERLCEYDASWGRLVHQVFLNRNALAGCGRPWRLYLRGDLDRLDLTQARCVWMLGMAELTQGEMRTLDESLPKGALLLHTDFAKTHIQKAPRGIDTNRKYATLLSAEELRGLLDQAGVHAYLQTGDVFYAGNGFVAIHAAAAGEKRIALPQAATVQQVLPAEGATQMTDAIVCSLQAFETRLYRVTL